MFIKAKKHDAFGAVAGYHQNKVNASQAKVLFSNLASTEPYWIGREMDAVAALAPRVTTTLTHICVSVYPEDEDKVSDRVFTEIALEIFERTGFARHQTIVWRHFDRPQPHIHLLANRVSPTGRVVLDWKDHPHLGRIRSELETRYGLRKTRAVEDSLIPWMVSSSPVVEGVDVRPERPIECVKHSLSC